MSEEGRAVDDWETPDGYSYEAREARRRYNALNSIARNMHHAWREDDQLLSKFFPFDPKYALAYQTARKELYNERKGRNRWTHIPEKLTSASNLYTPLAYLFNRILSLCKISRFRRTFFNTHIRRRDAYKTEPGIVLSGIGTEFLNGPTSAPPKDYMSFISAFEIVVDSDDPFKARNRLALHMHQIFQNQDNRRFAFGILMTQNTFTVYMFDHSGAVGSKPCNYHENPEQFFAVICGLAGEGASIGFDTTLVVNWDSFLPTVRTLESQNGGPPTETFYKITSRVFQFHELVGRGTMCWSVCLPEDSEQCFIIKDAWIAEDALAGRESEGSLLFHAQNMGIVVGVAQICHMEDVRLSPNSPVLDTIVHNRRSESTPVAGRPVDRIHTRIVMKTDGKTLEMFSTRKELILAFHDAVIAHRNLHQVAGILHRDISPRNILINANGVEGDRGILIDLDHAIRVGDTSPYSTKRKIGTWRYMSRDVLEGDEPHTFLDDLESFFYVFAWIVVTYRRPHKVIPEIPIALSNWNHPDASMSKHGLFVVGFKSPLSPWFGRCFHDLVLRLFDFIKSRSRLYLKPPPKPDAEKDYDEFIGHIRQCITEMEAEDRLAEDLAQSTSVKNGHVDAQTQRNPPIAHRKRQKRHKEPIFIHSGYPKRSSANYGS